MLSIAPTRLGRRGKARPPPPPGHHAPAAALARLRARWPCRDAPLTALVAALGGPNDRGRALLVHGPPASGKSSIVRDTLRELGRTAAYIPCRESSQMRSVARDIVDQLKGARRRKCHLYAREIKGDHVADFLDQLAGVAPETGPTRYVILDDAHALPGAAAGAAELVRAVEAACANVTVILIAPAAWATGAYSRDGCALPPLPGIEFGAYTPEEAVRVLAATGAPTARAGGGGDDTDASLLAAYAAMLRSSVLPAFGRDCTDLDFLAGVAAWLWPLYSAPGPDGRRRADAAAAAAVRPAVAAARRALDAGLPLPEYGGDRGDVGGGDDGGAGAASLPSTAAAPASGGGGGGGLDLELPYTAKFLLLAAHLASVNRETGDRTLFDATYRPPKRRLTAAAAGAAGRGAADAAGVQAEAATFPAERLLAIFWHLTAREGGDGRRPDESADAMAQLASLVSLGLLARERGGEAAHGGALDAARYSSRVPVELARRVARNVQLDLEAYTVVN